MTITEASGSISSRSIGAPRLLAGVRDHGHVPLAEHRAMHGAPTLRRHDWLVRATRDVNLLGRGGAAFPVSIKLASMPTGRTVHVLVNGSEGEPASHKDRTLMRGAPHLVIDGALIVAHALGTRQVTIATHDAASHDALRTAARERTDAHQITFAHSRGGFVAGEVRAVINGITTGVPRPGGRRVLPHERGLAHRPTFASNVETFAHLALLSSLGTADYARTGTPLEPGTSLVTLLGDVARRGVLEVPNGTPLEVLLPGRSEAPVLIGGYHGTWTRTAHDLPLTRESLRSAGSPLGAGVIARPLPDTCVLAEVAAVSRWLADQSVGQCGPCFFGLPALAEDMQAFADGTGSEERAGRRLQQVRGRGACAHPDGAVQFMSSAIVALADDIWTHRDRGSCGLPASTILPLPRSAR